MIRFLTIQNRQGKVRLAKYYVPYTELEKQQLVANVHRLMVPRDQRSQSNFVEVCRLPLAHPVPKPQARLPPVRGSVLLRMHRHGRQ